MLNIVFFFTWNLLLYDWVFLQAFPYFISERKVKVDFNYVVLFRFVYRNLGVMHLGPITHLRVEKLQN